MKKDLETWHFISEQLRGGQPVMLLVVAESSGSSPGRAGYKMAVAVDGSLCGSIGGGVMEVDLVERCRILLSAADSESVLPQIIEQVHQKNSPHASGMICSGQEKVILRMLSSGDIDTISDVIAASKKSDDRRLVISPSQFELRQATGDLPSVLFEQRQDNDFIYSERIETSGRLFIIGGGHCALALSEVMERLGFQISIFDDRPDLNTIEKNRFADSVTIVETYENVAEFVPSGDEVYIVVMTLGYLSDQVVVRCLLGRDVRYFGVLGSRAKVETMFRELRNEGLDETRLNSIDSPIGISINSHTPEEIAISIAAEIISVKNGAARLPLASGNG
ncbi:xanthine dehydrogenase accessory protein XdhC [soil metagenome]